ncbi:non-homologous end-joining DNA ligase [Rhizobium sp. BK418]|uniref:non-homologous end-joining DNA ligase n=1 Tax=Rhizobium sp. BK418 TaxID=2512120 RepID=UPI0010434ED8|nr:non-homologous end-joining DNA ligase [Rhizobium sp. BK418]TCR98616.1 bifunctional non-homologous end joining protein LigD [Rhizobium sp. BK418]
MTKSPKSKPLLQYDKPLRSRPRKPRDPAQPNLPLDPMPARIEPCLALLKQKPPKDDQWVFEIKWDGYRIAVHIEPRGVRILTRGGHDWTHRFPAIAAEAAQLGAATAILDGEAVILDERGRADFGMLQQSLGGRGGKLNSGASVMMAFDLLYFDGHDLRTTELESRRHLLEGLISPARTSAIRLSEEIEGDGDKLLQIACKHSLEGIIAKRRDSLYHSGRGGDWQKIKCIQSDSFAVVGWEKSTVARAGIGRLLLAARKGKKLVYVGGVGTGFNERNAYELREKLDNLVTSKPAVATDRKGAIYVKPKLIAEVEYRAWTREGMLRHASYKGLRDAADQAEIYEITHIS